MEVLSYSIDSCDHVDKITIAQDNGTKIEILRPDFEKIADFINQIEDNASIPYYVGLDIKSSPFIDKNILSFKKSYDKEE